VDTTTFVITHVFQNAAEQDEYSQNDTCVYKQKFLNYYAYDDGTAEYGYCLNNEFQIAFLAMKFPLRVPDSLSAVRMWFNHTRNNENANASFSIIVWKDTIVNNKSVPGKKMLTIEENTPEFSEQFLDFAEYRFDKKLAVSGTIWIGFEQQGNVQLNIGFDQNNDSREFFKYNTGGIWQSSVYKGVPMIRPVFGKLTIQNSINTQFTETVVGPNPTKNCFAVTNSAFRITRVEVYTMTGVKIFERQCFDNNVRIDLSHCPSGIYFVKIHKEDKTAETFKLIKN
jgi:hypothetical protein